MFLINACQPLESYNLLVFTQELVHLVLAHCKGNAYIHTNKIHVLHTTCLMYLFIMVHGHKAIASISDFFVSSVSIYINTA